MGALGERTHRFLHRLLVGISRLAALWQRSAELHTARFSHPHELETLVGEHWHNEAGLLLGSFAFNQVLSVRPTPKRRELGNVLITAPTRGGKGLLAVSQLLTWPHSVIVNDIKGDLYEQTAGYRQTLGPVYVVHPEGYGHQYDPLAGKLSEDELYGAAHHMLFVPNERDPVFTQREIVMLTQILRAARAEGAPPFAFARQCDHDGLKATAAKLDTISSDLSKRFLSCEFKDANFDNRFLLSAWEGLSAKLYPFLTEETVRSISGSDFTAETLMTGKRPVTVYVQVPELNLEFLAPLVRLLWGSFMDELNTTYDRRRGRGCNPVLLLIDEAGRTAIPSLANHVATVNGRGISLWVSIQSLSQLEYNYGLSRARTIRDNMDSQLYYRPADLETAKYLEERLGRCSAYARSNTTRDGGGDSEGLSEQAIPLLTAFEIHLLKDEDIVGFHRLLPPFRAKRMDWRRFRLLRERQAMPAPSLPVLPPLTNLPTSIWAQIRKRPSPFVDPDSPYEKN